MMALFYLATFYCALRYWSALAVPLPSREGLGEGSLLQTTRSIYRPLWLTLAIVACLCGMLSKEVMVSAPIMIVLFERTFVAGTFGNALRRSWPLYVGLALTWIPLLALSANSPRSFSSGFHLNSSPFVWWFTQCKVVLMYLKLAIWPWPLRCAYELPKVDNLVEFIVYVIPVLLLAALAILLLIRNHPVGFILTFVAAALAPTSIMPIMTEMAAERRMYLPLVAIVALVVVVAYLFGKRQWALSIAAGESSLDSNTPSIVAFVSLVAIAGVYGIMSSNRISAYYDEMLMWQQVAESQPLNHIAHTKLGLLYNRAGREAESLAELKKAVDATPAYPNGQSAYGFALINAGRLPEAIDHIKAALNVKPDHVGALNNMGIALTRMGQYPEAIEYLERAVTIDPTHADAHNNLGQALLKAGRTDEASQHFQLAKSLTPDDPDVLDNLAAAMANNNQLPQAIELLEKAVELRPDFAAAHNHLAICLHRSGDVAKAMQHFQRFLELQPEDPSAYFNLASAAAEQKDFKKAAAYFETAVRLQPESADAHNGLATALAQTGQLDEAIGHFQLALQLNPQCIAAYSGLAEALAAANRLDEAKQVAARGIEIATSQGDQPNAKKLTDWLQSHSK
jgi:tetratricopeptide (TPR) repeat protein